MNEFSLGKIDFILTHLLKIKHFNYVEIRIFNNKQPFKNKIFVYLLVPSIYSYLL